MPPRPAIGLITALELASYGIWETTCALSPHAYVTAIQRAGGLVVMIPPDPELVRSPEEMLDRIDALVLAGGGDIDPGCYGQARRPETSGVVHERDELELALAASAIERELPVLGICRGMQLINVALGGTLHQHLPQLLGHGEHRRRPGSFEGSEHEVLLEPSSLAARAVGAGRSVIKSHHHQGIDRLGEGLEITGRSALDELPEALEAPDRDYLLGVQWHPEADPASRVITSLVEHARERALARD
jgi:putative glutamine amidotransferase